MVFGHVIQGTEIVQDIENQPTNDKSRPLADIRIENCGELIPKSKAKGKKTYQSFPWWWLSWLPTVHKFQDKVLLISTDVKALELWAW